MKMHRHEQISSQGRHDLAGEHFITDIGQLVLLIIFLAVWITDSFLFHYTDFPTRYVPLYIRLSIAVVTLIVSIFFVVRAHQAVFGRSAAKNTLLTKGVFSIVRHPMYFGAGLFFVALVFSTLSLSSAAVCVVIFVFYYAVSKTEERLLAQKFGSEYKEYKMRVPMLFPLR